MILNILGYLDDCLKIYYNFSVVYGIMPILMILALFSYSFYIALLRLESYRT